MNFGNHENLHVSVKGYGITFKLVFFFDTEEAHILKTVIRNSNVNFNLSKIYEELKNTINEWDYNLITPKYRLLKQRFNNTKELLNHIKQTKNES